jgi:hypothetical protein
MFGNLDPQFILDRQRALQVRLVNGHQNEELCCCSRFRRTTPLTHARLGGPVFPYSTPGRHISTRCWGSRPHRPRRPCAASSIRTTMSVTSTVRGLLSACTAARAVLALCISGLLYSEQVWSFVTKPCAHSFLLAHGLTNPSTRRGDDWAEHVHALRAHVGACGASHRYG